jgi:hypothetical protein
MRLENPPKSTFVQYFVPAASVKLYAMSVLTMGLTYSSLDPCSVEDCGTECRTCGTRFADASGSCPECGGELRNVGLPTE